MPGRVVHSRWQQSSRPKLVPTVNLPEVKVWKKNKSDLLKLLRGPLDAESRGIHESGLRINRKLR